MNAPTGRSVGATVERASRRVMVHYGRGTASLDSLAIKFGIAKQTARWRHRKLKRPLRVFSWLFTTTKEQFDRVVEKFNENPGELYENPSAVINPKHQVLEKVHGRVGRGCNYGKIDKELESYVIKKIEVPIAPSQEYMLPFRRLAASVIADAAGDLNPEKIRGKVSAETQQMNLERIKSNARRFLLGESDPADLELWCNLSRMPKEVIAREVINNNERLLARLKELYKQRKRGRPKKD